MDLTQELKYDSHCRRHGCTCSHRACYRGWRDKPDQHATAPCVDCRPTTYERWLKAMELRTKGYPFESVANALRGGK